jgi:hypothetical protein
LATFTSDALNFVCRRHFQVGKALLLFALLGRIMYILAFYLAHVVLLGTKDRAWASDSNPANENLSWDLVVLHAVDTNESTCAAKTSLTVNSDGAVFGIGEVIFTTFDKLINNVIRRSGAVHEDKVFMLDSVLFESSLVIFGVVEANDFAHLQMLKNVNITATRVAISALTFLAVNGTHEGNKFVGDDPVEVTVLNFFIMLVLLDTEFFMVVPALLDTKLETLKAMLYRALVVAFTFGGITIGAE